MEDFPPHKIQELRRLVDHHLREGNVYAQIRQVLAEYTADEGRQPGGNTLLQLLNERGMVEKMVESVACKQAPPVKEEPKLQTDKGRHLHVKLLGGRAFLEHLDTINKGEMLTVHMQFGSQRFQSSPVECECDPDFDDSFLINLDHELARARDRGLRLPNGRDLLKLDTPLQIVLTRTDTSRRTTRHVGENVTEWRNVLKTGAVNMSVELGGGMQGLKVPVGVLELQLELLPFYRMDVSEQDVTHQINAEKNNATASDREFLVYARRWWEELHAISDIFSTRNVKVFANYSSHSLQTSPVTSFVAPLTAPRVLDSPLQSARFVSLLTYDKDDDKHVTSGAGQSDTWTSLLSFLCKGKGDYPEHANLLCSLLIGHGLDAYVALGATEAGHRTTCVLTKIPNHGFAPSILLWDVLTGARYLASGADVEGLGTVGSWTGLVKVHCLYSHEFLAASMQADDHVACTSFDFDDETLWKVMNPIKLKLVSRIPLPAIMRPLYSPSQLNDLETSIENDLIKHITSHRDQMGIVTSWDRAVLPHVVSQALWSYEYQKLTGVQLESRTFQSAIKSNIRQGQNCTAFPVHFSHTSPIRMLNHFISNKHTKDIVELYGDEVTHVLRVKITPYAESVCSVWVMLAAVFRAA
eukprot:TRINITY_DN1964_c0_g2_i1.p1 TRINITY_DN1964_c0_g2~~TRINITY_DN1964_c0_g2_i1.p1  ORF type:complete len:667 (+),score=167.76 TRINITY_DN1964_c0_g2_i1:87-2003(+)